MKLLSIAFIPMLALCLQGNSKNPASQPSATPPKPPQEKPKSPTAVKPMKVILDEKELSFGDNGVRVLGGRTFVPFRPLFEAMGATVDYDLVHKKVTATKDNNEIELTVGDLVARKNGAEITMEAAPQILNKATYVPLRFVAESLDAKVNFDGANNTITINTKS